MFHRVDDNFGTFGRWTGGVYTCQIDERGPGRGPRSRCMAAGQLTPFLRPGDAPVPPYKLEIERRISIASGSSDVHVDVTITNRDAMGKFPGLRYVIHALYQQTLLPGPLFYVFLPTATSVQAIDYEQTTKGNYLARTKAMDGGAKGPLSRLRLAGRRCFRRRTPISFLRSKPIRFRHHFYRRSSGRLAGARAGESSARPGSGEILFAQFWTYVGSSRPPLSGGWIVDGAEVSPKTGPGGDVSLDLPGHHPSRSNRERAT